MTTIFSIQGSWVTISDIPSELREKLERATRFRPVGAIYQNAYRYGKWDGYIRMLKGQRIPYGLLPRVARLWRESGCDYQILASADSFQTGKTITEAPFCGTLRDYQFDAVVAAKRARMGTLRAPTGAGKTMIAMGLIDAIGKQALVVVPTIDLLYQFKHMAEEIMPNRRIGKLGDGTIDPQDITIGTVRTVARVLGVGYESYEYAEVDDHDDTDGFVPDSWVKDIGVLIIDEAQILGARSVFDLTMTLPIEHKYGVSASPWRDDGCDLMIEAAVGPQCYRITTDTLLRDGWLVKPITRLIDMSHVQKNLESGGTWADVYRTAIVKNEARNKEIAQVVDELMVRGYQVLVLVKQISHGKALAKLIPSATFAWGATEGEERDHLYQSMRAGTTKVLIASTIADMGLDIPSLGALVLAGGGKSSTRHLQRIGRICRPYEGKTHGLVVDFDDSGAHKWFAKHLKERLKIANAEWDDMVILDF